MSIFATLSCTPTGHLVPIPQGVLCFLHIPVSLSYNTHLGQLYPDSAVYLPCIPSSTTFWSRVCFPNSSIATLLIHFSRSPPAGDQHLLTRHASALFHVAPILGNLVGGMVELLIVAQLPYLGHQNRWVARHSPQVDGCW